MNKCSGAINQEWQHRHVSFGRDCVRLMDKKENMKNIKRASHKKETVDLDTQEFTHSVEWMNSEQTYPIRAAT